MVPYGFDKSADLLSKCQNRKADFFQIMCASKKARTLPIFKRPQIGHEIRINRKIDGLP